MEETRFVKITCKLLLLKVISAMTLCVSPSSEFSEEVI